MNEQVSASINERTLNAAAGMDAVTLKVGNLENMTSYYAEALAMEPIEEVSRDKEVHRVLGRGTTPLLKLVATPDLPGVDPRQAGLFHTAFLYEDRPALAATVYRAAQDQRSRFAGSSDHLVSEAFYFTDPEGNGIELYVDRDRSEWRHSANGDIMMDTLRLDPNVFLQEHLSEEAIETVAKQPGKIGHVHLQVGDVDAARAFYVDAIGFEPTVDSYPGALFTSAGGYHHHVAMNIWNSQGAGTRVKTLGLGDVAITVPDRADLDMLIARLHARNIEFADTGAHVRLQDPWGTQVTVAVGASNLDEVLAR